MTLIPPTFAITHLIIPSPYSVWDNTNIRELYRRKFDVSAGSDPWRESAVVGRAEQSESAPQIVQVR